MKKHNLILPVSILLGCIILGGFVFVSQISKQKSIEKQQQTELQAKTEQDKREYLVKRKKDCYDYETAERKKFNNVDGSFYDEVNDVCEVRYVNEKWKEGDPNSCSDLEGFFWNGVKKSTCTIEHFFTKEF